MQNFTLYRASAGSGKTYTLVKEYLTLCLADENPSRYRRILAITFTNASANDMKAKIIDHLKKIIDKTEGNMISDLLKSIKSYSKKNISEDLLRQRAKEVYYNLLHNYSDFNVSTIDSFVQTIARPFTTELKLPAQYMLLIDNETFIDVIMELLADELSQNTNLQEVLSKFAISKMEDSSNWRIERPIREFIQSQMKDSVSSAEKILDENEINFDNFNEIIETLSTKIEEAYKAIEPTQYKEKIDQFNAKYNLTDDDYKNANRGGFPSIIKKIENGQKDIVTNTTKKFLEEGGMKDSSLNDEATELYSNIVQSYVSTWDRYHLLLEVRKTMYYVILRKTIRELIDRYIKENNTVPLSEFNKRIALLLRENETPFIYVTIGEKFHNIFIDEFQDTSILQWQNMLPLVVNSLSNGEKCLVVGDAKQAIYRFRDGNVNQIVKLPEIFASEELRDSELIEMMLKNSFESQTLSNNYRSAKEIVEYNNEFFQKIREKLTDVDYRKVYGEGDDSQLVENAVKPSKSKDVEVCFYEKNDETIYEDWTNEQLFEKIKQLVTEEGYSFGDITILVRANNKAYSIASYLMGKEVDGKMIRVASASSLQLYSSPKIRLIVEILRVFAQRDIDITKATIIYLFNQIQNKPLGKLPDDYKDRYEDLINELRSQIVETHDVYELSYRLIKALSNTVKSDFLEDVFVQYFLNEVNKWQQNQIADLSRFIDFWETKKGSLSIEDDAHDALKIMTIHKSKGLEFKVVLYPYAPEKILGKNDEFSFFRVSDFEVLRDLPAEIKSFRMVVSSSKWKSDNDGGLWNTILKKEYDEHVSIGQLDNINIVYVAMTRPTERLIVFTKPGIFNKGR